MSQEQHPDGCASQSFSPVLPSILRASRVVLEVGPHSAASSEGQLRIAMMNQTNGPSGHLTEASTKSIGLDVVEDAGDGNPSKKLKRSEDLIEDKDDLAGTPAPSEKPIEEKDEETGSVMKPSPPPGIEDDECSGRSQPDLKGTTTEEGADESLEKATFTFPARLMELLEGGVEKEALWWLDGGDCFCVVPKLFAERVLNKYFQSTKFESFTRKLNRWGFKRAAGHHVPANTIAYYHSHFKRGCKDLLKNMRGTKKRDHSDSDAPFSHAGVSMSAMQLPSIHAAASAGGLFSQSGLAASAHLRSLALAGGTLLPGGGRFVPPDLLSSSGALNAWNPNSHDLQLQSLLATQQNELARMQRVQLLNAELAMNAQLTAELQERQARAIGAPWFPGIPTDLASSALLASAQAHQAQRIPSIMGRMQQQGRSMSSSGVDAALLQRVLDRQRRLDQQYE